MSSSSLKSTLKVQKELLLIQDSSGVICKKSPSCRGKHQISICRPTVTQGKPCLPGGGTTFIQIVPVGKLTVDMSRHISQISLLINVWEMLRALSWARRINDVFFFFFYLVYTSNMQFSFTLSKHVAFDGGRQCRAACCARVAVSRLQLTSHINRCGKVQRTDQYWPLCVWCHTGLHPRLELRRKSLMGHLQSYMKLQNINMYQLKTGEVISFQFQTLIYSVYSNPLQTYFIKQYNSFIMNSVLKMLCVPPSVSVCSWVVLLTTLAEQKLKASPVWLHHHSSVFLTVVSEQRGHVGSRCALKLVFRMIVWKRSSLFW